MSPSVRTPFELSLENDLNVEAQRFHNSWLFKWHGMTYEGGATDVDDYRGGRIHYRGIKYGFQQQQIFWQAFGRYLSQTVHDTFKKWDNETRGYPADVRLKSIDGVELALRRFVTKLTADAVDTDQRLRGQGYPSSVGKFDAVGYSTQAGAEITSLGAAHRSILEGLAKETTIEKSLKQRIEDWLSAHKGILGLIGLAIALLGLALRLFGKI